ncbi:COG2404 Predicted phosphohydrolase (DHH superfamily) [uncultured Caudovirales phage]|uniref:COG2404 Predicted phosphohydrolase (DHH superfamily) n=1 Tax=uncultured Caudovirales phage TaxID=2100421 RepID=A0A6J5MAD5_9CAUD|nr:COG2404 Predicted phosphohydrolase (DHH superfamily) [uncultured Caudovirales phage]
MQQEKSVRVIYHGNCADGFGAAWAAWKALGDDAEYTAGVYNEPPPDCTGQTVYLVDFSYKREVLLKMAETAKTVEVIDHHASAMKDLEGIAEQAQKLGLNNVWTYFNMEHSGAMLAWQFFHPGQAAPKLLEYIEDRDLWRFRLANSKELSAYIFSYGYTFEDYSAMAGTFQYENIREKAVEQGRAIIRKQDKDLAELLSTIKHKQTIAGQTVLIANLPYMLASEGGNQLSRNQPFAATYYDTGLHRVFSLRSQKDSGVDVSKIAQLFGGGGHVNASGFRLLHEDPLDPRPMAQRLAYPVKDFPQETDDD